MKLKDRRKAPVGGYWFVYELVKDGETVQVRVNSNEGGIDGLIRRVKADMVVNSQPVPEDLDWIVEDQICQRQPEGQCFYEHKVGDQIANLIHIGARMVDGAVQAVTGSSPNLEKKAKGCPSCNKRRKTLNNLS